MRYFSIELKFCHLTLIWFTKPWREILMNFMTTRMIQMVGKQYFLCLLGISSGRGRDLIQGWFYCKQHKKRIFHSRMTKTKVTLCVGYHYTFSICNKSMILASGTWFPNFSRKKKRIFFLGGGRVGWGLLFLTYELGEGWSL